PIFVLLVVFAVIEGKPSPPLISASTSAWPPGAYCIMQAGSACPSSFNPTELKLSVPQAILPGMTDSAGNTLIQLGRAGNSGLYASSYDSIYTLDLVLCCKIS
ncbi:hypothetical protein PFISCL1PPCAC_6265, partial [Pristionchus fissidentatus]